MRVILKMGHIPVGMEMFNAADEEQWKTITRRIDESDYYIVVIGQRYGSTTSEGISFTEKEYDYAVEKGIPVLGFLIEQDAPWPGRFVDKGQAAISLEKFKEKTRKRIIEYWSSTQDLQGRITMALAAAMDTNPRNGWVRPSEAVGAEVTKELSRLSSENSILRDKIRELSDALVEEKRNEIDKTVSILKENAIVPSVYYEDSENWEAVDEVSLYFIFFSIAPSLINENDKVSISLLLALYFSDSKRQLRSVHPVPSNSLDEWIGDLSVVGLLEPSIRSRSKADKRSFWTLTDLGREVYSSIRREKLTVGRKARDDIPDSTNGKTSRRATKATKSHAKTAGQRKTKKRKPVSRG